MPIALLVRRHGSDHIASEYQLVCVTLALEFLLNLFGFDLSGGAETWAYLMLSWSNK